MKADRRVVTVAMGEALVTEATAALSQKAREKNTRKITNQRYKALLSRDLHPTVCYSNTNDRAVYYVHILYCLAVQTVQISCLC